jgi:acetoin:2,6-dichlorophenolindophenol oxidoreductase subunit beta
MPAVEMSYRDAVNAALRDCLAADSSVVMMGEDIGSYGGAFQVTRGLQAEFGVRRVLDTPIAENGFCGAAAGMAMGGLRPVVEILLVDFFPVAMDALVNQIAKQPVMSGGQYRMPVTVWSVSGSYRSAGPQSGEMLEAMLAHASGWTVAMPSNPADARGLVTAAIRSDEPVAVIGHFFLLGARGEVPDEPYEVPLGKASVARSGSDVTLVTYSHFVQRGLAAAATLQAEGVDVEVVDLRTVVPLDMETVRGSVLKTGRVVIAHEARRRCGIGAEVAARLAEDEVVLDALQGPIIREAAANRAFPASQPLEDACLPSETSIAAALRRAMQ